MEIRCCGSSNMTRPLIQRFLEKIDVLENKCWVWTGCVARGGYGIIRINGHNYYAHRVSYELYKNNISTGLEVDHLCRNSSCVNPDHLEPVTPRENTLRSDGVAAHNSKKTHCKHEHPLSGENLYVWKNIGRFCKACNRRIKHDSYLNKKVTLDVNK